MNTNQNTVKTARGNLASKVKGVPRSGLSRSKIPNFPLLPALSFAPMQDWNAKPTRAATAEAATGCASACVAGACQAVSHTGYSCHNGDIWWFDSCGGIEDMITPCQWGCEGTTCNDQPCQPDYSYFCSGGDVWEDDGCGNQQEIENCQYVCEDGLCVSGLTCTATEYWEPASMSSTATSSSVTLEVEFQANSNDTGGEDKGM